MALIRINSACQHLQQDDQEERSQMSVRNLDKLFKPRSVALIGATPRLGSVGAMVARNLRRAGFAGELMLVNPHHDAIEGLRIYPTAASLPQPPDLAVIITPPEAVPSMPQLGLLYLLVFLPMNMLSGSNTPLESMPTWLATIMQVSPSTHFASLAQAILYRGTGIAVVWPQFVIVALIGGCFLWIALLRFRKVAAAVM